MAKLTEDERLFRKIEDKIKRAIFDYGLINDGDRILVGLSGGKDSLALVDLRTLANPPAFYALGLAGKLCLRSLRLINAIRLR